MTSLAYDQADAWSEADQDAARAEWERTHGWRVTTQTYPCLTRRLTRRRCPGTGCCWWVGSKPRALDHVRGIVRIHDGLKGVLTMPYRFSERDAAELSKALEPLDASWHVVGTGWHHPGTVAVVIAPRRRSEKTEEVSS